MNRASSNMTSSHVTIDFLGRHRDAVPLIAKWHWDEWGGDYPGDSLAKWTEQLARKTSTNSMPCAWIALVDGVPVGSVVLELDGVEPRPDLKPALSGLYVLVEHRNKGIGSGLVAVCEEGARGLGVSDLYLDTEKAQALYARLGWGVVEHTEFLGHPATIMHKAL